MDKKIKCLECGKSYKMLYHHLIKMHNLTIEQYSIKHDLPYKTRREKSRAKIKKVLEILKTQNVSFQDACKMAGYKSYTAFSQTIRFNKNIDLYREYREYRNIKKKQDGHK